MGESQAVEVKPVYVVVFAFQCACGRATIDKRYFPAVSANDAVRQMQDEPLFCKFCRREIEQGTKITFEAQPDKTLS